MSNPDSVVLAFNMRQKVTKPIIHTSQCLSHTLIPLAGCLLNGKMINLPAAIFFFVFASFIQLFPLVEMSIVKVKENNRKQANILRNIKKQQATLKRKQNNDEIEQKVTPFCIFINVCLENVEIDTETSCV